ncbi:MAG: hypothetical protein KC466_02265, partial [Myxococcales bacterium]|nr:hypothetical protein [Myxococcales bacterium]
MMVAKSRMSAWCSVALLAAVAPFGSCVPVEPKPGLVDAARDLTASLPVFPGAEGYGTDTPAGRGGVVIRVTTLAAEGPGSLREAAATPGPRAIVFEVGGAIALTEDIVVSRPYVTIAGQTAPSPGVTL